MSNAGRSGRGLLLGIALLFVVGLAWLWLEMGAPARGKTAPTSTGDPAPPAPEIVVAPALRSAPPTESPSEELEALGSARTDATRFHGKLGSIRGRIEVTGEEPFPRSWRLVARPSTTLPAREHAVERNLEFQEGRQDFELRELPLGGYDVFGEAEGYNGQVLPVLLERGSEHPFVSLRFVPAGRLEGRVLDAAGLPAEGLPISLFPVGQSVPLEARTDQTGLFRFERLPDGAYELLVGKPTAPLLPERRPLHFRAPHLTFPDLTLPELGAIHVRVVDSLARPLEGVEVRGSGTNGGTLEGRTDYNGELWVRHLPAGHFRIRLEHPALGQEYERRVAVDVVAGQTAEAPVRLGP